MGEARWWSEVVGTQNVKEKERAIEGFTKDTTKNEVEGEDITDNNLKSSQSYWLIKQTNNGKRYLRAS